MGYQGNYATMSVKVVRLSNLLHRHNSKAHSLAAARYVGLQDVPDSSCAPTAAHFKTVWVAKRKGESCGTEVGSPWKQRRMVWCIAEAMRNMERSHILRSKVMVLHQDGRKHRHTVRFSAIDGELRMRRGLLGHVDFVVDGRTEEPGAVAIKKGAVEVIANFCTRGHGAPDRARGLKPRAQKQHVQAFGVSVLPPRFGLCSGLFVCIARCWSPTRQNGKPSMLSDPLAGWDMQLWLHRDALGHMGVGGVGGDDS